MRKCRVHSTMPALRRSPRGHQLGSGTGRGVVVHTDVHALLRLVAFATLVGIASASLTPKLEIVGADPAILFKGSSGATPITVSTGTAAANATGSSQPDQLQCSAAVQAPEFVCKSDGAGCCAALQEAKVRGERSTP